MAERATITKIETQKKRKNRRSIFIDDEFAFGVDAEIVAQLGLREGEAIDQETIAEILSKEEKKQAREKAYRYLAGRAHSEKELKTKLQQKGFDQKTVEEVIAELKSHKFVDDEAFAISYARSRLVNAPIGERRLRQELWLKGVDEEIIARAVQEAYLETPQAELARRLAEKQGRRYRDLDEAKRKKRLSEFLLRRGFEWDLVKEVVEETLSGKKRR